MYSRGFNLVHPIEGTILQRVTPDPQLTNTTEPETAVLCPPYHSLSEYCCDELSRVIINLDE